MDEHWYFAVNRSDTGVTIDRTSLVDMGPGDIYIEYDQWPAGTVDSHGGCIMTREGVNEKALLFALDAAIERQKRNSEN